MDPIDGVNAPKPNIMVIDDTPDNLRLLVGMLSEQGYKARPVPNGKLALSAVQAAPPDLILLDINMPDLNGYQVCEKLKSDSETREIPVIFLSALGETLDKVKAFNVGGVDYITKPFQIEEVLVRVQTHLRLRQLRRELEEINLNLEERVRHRTEELMKVTEEKVKMERDLDIARRIQASMLPRTFPAFPERDDIDVWGSMEPAKQVGGDLYDFFLIDERHLFFCLGDVSGKGVPAALFMATVKTLVKDKALAGVPPADLLFQVNNSLLPDNDNCMFASLFCGVLDLDEQRMECANGGHNPPLVWTPETSEFQYLDEARGLVLAVAPVEAKVYQQQIIDLPKGGILFLYSDGVTEAVDAHNDQFSENRLRSTLNHSGGDASPETLVKNVETSLANFVGDEPQFDDITMLAVKHNAD